MVPQNLMEGLHFISAKVGKHMPSLGKMQPAYANEEMCEVNHRIVGMLRLLTVVTSAFSSRAKTARKKGDVSAL
jgi:hypothetical protein